MTLPKSTYHQTTDLPSSVVREDAIEYGFIGTLQRLKYEYRPDITDRAKLEQNFREKSEALNRVRLTDGGFAPPPHQTRPRPRHLRTQRV